MALPSYVTLLAGSGTAASTDGTGASASFNAPSSVAADSKGVYAYVAEITGNRIRRVEVATGVVTTVAGSGTAGSADGTGTAATTQQPVGLCFDPTQTYLYWLER